MSVEFWMGLLAGAVLAALATLYLATRRRELGEPLDWTDAAYEPRHEQPRAITRIKSADLDWEIK